MTTRSLQWFDGLFLHRGGLRKSRLEELDLDAVELFQSLVERGMGGEVVNIPRITPALRMSATPGTKFVSFQLITDKGAPFATIGVTRNSIAKHKLWPHLVEGSELPVVWSSAPNSQTWFAIRMEPAAIKQPDVEVMLWSVGSYLCWGWWAFLDRRRKTQLQ